MRLFEINGTVRVVVDRQILLAVASWRLLDVDARSGALTMYGVFHGLGGDPWKRIVAGVAPDDAAVASDALAERFHLPNVLVSVDAQELERNPRAYDGRHIESVGVWTHGFESSRFAGAWLDGPMPANAPAAARGRRVMNVRVRGLWRSGGTGYGHLGMSPSGLYAYAIDPC